MPLFFFFRPSAPHNHWYTKFINFSVSLSVFNIVRSSIFPSLHLSITHSFSLAFCPARIPSLIALSPFICIHIHTQNRRARWLSRELLGTFGTFKEHTEPHSSQNCTEGQKFLINSYGRGESPRKKEQANDLQDNEHNGSKEGFLDFPACLCTDLIPEAEAE